MKAFLKFLIFCWIILAVFNVFYNLVKTVPEIREWGHLSDSEKRNKIFGDYYDFLVLLKINTKENDRILIYSKDGDKWGTFFQSIYYLYPRRVTTTVDKKEFASLTNNAEFTYIATFDSMIYPENYEKVASFSSKMTTSYGVLYKLK